MSVRERLRAFIAETFFVEGFADDASFLREGLIDSMGLSQLVAFVEVEFRIEVADEELVPENLDSLGGLARFVERKLHRTAA